jgi:hypothetical protein
LSHLRTEAYGQYGSPQYPARTAPASPLSYEENVNRIGRSKHQIARKTRPASAQESRTDGGS